MQSIMPTRKWLIEGGKEKVRKVVMDTTKTRRKLKVTQMVMGTIVMGKITLMHPLRSTPPSPNCLFFHAL
jgi:hypothetical protein